MTTDSTIEVGSRGISSSQLETPRIVEDLSNPESGYWGPDKTVTLTTRPRQLYCGYHPSPESESENDALVDR